MKTRLEYRCYQKTMTEKKLDKGVAISINDAVCLRCNGMNYNCQFYDGLSQKDRLKIIGFYKR